METTVTDFRYRIGAALHRASLLGDRLSSTCSATELSKTIDEVRKLVRQLQVSFEDLTHVMSEHLQAKEQAETIRQRGAMLFRLVPTPCIVVDRRGIVIDMNPAASTLLNTAPRFASGRQFSLFLDGERPNFLRALQDVQRSGDPQQLMVTVRPRERAPIGSALVVTRGRPEELLLIFHVENGPRPARRGRWHASPSATAEES
jgi:PAS domain-containing protein